MNKPTITTVDGVKHEMKPINGRAYRIVSEFDNTAPQISDADFIERHAALVAEFFDVTADDVLDMPLEDILPASIQTRRTVIQLTWQKTVEISKNAEEDKAQSA